MKQILLTAAIAFAIAAPQAFAAKTKTTKTTQDAAANAELEAARKVEQAIIAKWTIPADKYEQLRKEALERGKSRKIAADDFGEAQLSNEFKKEMKIKDRGVEKTVPGFRDQVLGVRSADQIDHLLDVIDENYASWPNDVKFAAAQIRTIRPFKSFVYRIRPLFETHKQVKILHTAVLSFAQMIAGSVGAIFPANPPAGEANAVNAVFHYVTEPFQSADTGDQAPFKSERQLQAFIGGKVLPVIATAYDDINAIRDALPKDSSFTADAGLGYQFAAKYQNGKDIPDMNRYRNVGVPELRAVAAGYAAGLASIHMLTAYNIDRITDVIRDVSDLYTLDSLPRLGNGMFNLGGVNGATSEERTAKIKSKGEFLTLLEGREQWARDAFKLAHDSMDAAALAYDELKARPGNARWALDSTYLTAEVTRVGDVAVGNMRAMFAGEATIYSEVTGKAIKVNIEPMFGGISDLKDLLPTTFDHAEGRKFYKDKYETSKVIDGKEKRYRDYFYGRPVAWNNGVYGKVLPGTTDIPEAIRILGSSFGGQFAMLPLAFVGF